MNRVLITGAAGYLGRALARRLIELNDAGQRRFDTLTLLDRQLGTPPGQSPQLRCVEGDLREPRVLDEALSGRPDTVFHLAGITSRQAEADVALGLGVNVLASIALLERLREQGTRPVLVFSSSIGVFGTPLPTHIDDLTVPQPTLSYGAQKRMIEILLADYSRRGAVHGMALRLPGVVARPAQPGGALSAFASDLLRELAEGRRFVCPVSADAPMWFMSLPVCVHNLLHAAALAPTLAPADRSLTLPALRASVSQIVDALARRHGDALRRRIEFRPDPALQAQFAAWPPLSTAAADRLGFCDDGDLDRLLSAALPAP
jgi:nucleoside-diphosphate-sugar epimerase